MLGGGCGLGAWVGDDDDDLDGVGRWDLGGREC